MPRSESNPRPLDH